MSEKSKQFENLPELRLFQVVGVPYHDGIQRCVVVELIEENPSRVFTAHIINEGTETERLAMSGTTDVATSQPTDEIWSRERVLKAMAVTWGANTPESLAKLDEFLPNKTD